MKTRRLESGSPYSRIHRRRARATSSRSCSGACRTLWDGPPLHLGSIGCLIKPKGKELDQIAVLGIDLGKNSCSVVGLDSIGAVIKRRRMRPESIAAFTKKLPACIIAMEACCGAHHLGRIFAGQGHQVRLMLPEDVRPYVRAQRNDVRDAEAIAVAATRPTIRFVGLKNESQLDVQTLIVRVIGLLGSERR